MDDKRHDISQIRKYLNGELDARAMHRLEREAQDDPFLMDAMDGYEQATGLQQRQLNDLDAMLEKRIGEGKVRRIIPWKYYAAAASVLLFLTLGYWFWPGRQEAPQNKQMANVVKAPAPADHAVANADTVARVVADSKALAANIPPATAGKPRPQFRQATVVTPAAADAAMADEPVRMADDKAAIDYNYASAAKAPTKNATLDELLKKMDGMQVDSNGNITSKGQAISKVRLNGKDYKGNDAQQVVKNLPADIIEKAQVIDDYGDQATKTGIKTGDPTKTLSIATRRQPLKDSVMLKEVVIPGLAKLSQKDIDKKATASQTLKGKVEGAEVTTPKKISGTILSDLGLPLPGATVFVDGTKKATQTDAQGHFSIPAEGQATLNIQSLGYENKKINARANDSVRVALQAHASALAEVVVVNPGPVIKEAHPQMGWDNYNKYLQRQAIGDKAGTVRLSFKVSSKGELSEFRVLNSLDADADKKAIDLIKNGPRWNGDAGGKTKTVKLNIEFSKHNDE